MTERDCVVLDQPQHRRRSKTWGINASGGLCKFNPVVLSHLLRLVDDDTAALPLDD